MALGVYLLIINVLPGVLKSVRPERQIEQILQTKDLTYIMHKALYLAA
jgi:hypothetical protein